MKKLFLIAFLGFYTTFSYCQKFHGGLFIGIAASQISGDQLSGYNKAGIFAGGFANFLFTEKLALQLEISFIQKGSRKNPRPKTNDYTIYKLNIQYVEMPFLFKWDFSKRFYLEVGPSIGIIINNTGREKDEGGLINNPQRPVFNRFDYCGVLGMGVSISKNFKTNIRTIDSFIPVRKPVVGTSYRLDRFQYNTTIALSLIYQIK
jgi:hypothetical protein